MIVKPEFGGLQDSLSSAPSLDSFIKGLNFGDVYKEEGSKSQPNIVECGELIYKVKTELPDKSSYFSSDDRGNDSSESAEFVPVSTEDVSLDLVPQFLQLSIAPLQPALFLSQLPVHLSRFIQESVEIIKNYNKSFDSFDYTFKFKALDLNIILSKQTEGLKIVIQVGSQELKKEFDLNAQDVMKHYLNTRLDLEQLDINFEFLDSASDFSDSDDSSQSDASDRHDQDDQDQDQDVDV
ncbi:hypothetical protein DID78_05170 [Candidatus Marinamargulisbacteria bacterium SCGC AG-343-D04]|nr:hypothetical protein DID78_05170 [Candidatus Marinamargulisbacteria bacterium SCGC AG-343-D04]